jgi:predicted dehydrogenase
MYQRAKTLLDSRELGAMHRSEMVETFWRISAHYRSGAWRATWRGEGGGVVLNQAQHVPDRYLWLCGVPTSVTGFCDTALHEIEVEDTATAVMRHENGRHGWIHVIPHTTECPSLSRTVFDESHQHVFRFDALGTDFRIKLHRALALRPDYELAREWRQKTSWPTLAEMTLRSRFRIGHGDRID